MLPECAYGSVDPKWKKKRCDECDGDGWLDEVDENGNPIPCPECDDGIVTYIY